MRKGVSEAAGLICVLLGAGACAISRENVWHDPGLIRYPGYRVEYSEATPKPGTPVVRGALVRFTVKVRYVLQAKPKGHVVMIFRGPGDSRLLPGQEVASEIVGGTGTATLSQEVTIPDKLDGMRLWLAVVPEGIRETDGAVNIWYPVRQGR